MYTESRDPYHTRPEDAAPAQYPQDEADAEAAEKKKRTLADLAEAAIDVIGEVVEAIIDAVT